MKPLFTSRNYKMVFYVGFYKIIEVETGKELGLYPNAKAAEKAMIDLERERLGIKI